MKKSIFIFVLIISMAFNSLGVLYAADKGPFLMDGNTADMLDYVPVPGAADTVEFTDIPDAGAEADNTGEAVPLEPSGEVEIEDHQIEDFEPAETVGLDAYEEPSPDEKAVAVYADGSGSPENTDAAAVQAETASPVFDGAARASAPRVSMSFDNVSRNEASVGQEIRLNLTMSVDMAYLYIYLDGEENRIYKLEKDALSANPNDYSLIISFPCKGTYTIFVDTYKDGQWYTGRASAVSIYVGDAPEAYYMELDKTQTYAGEDVKLNINIKNADRAVMYVENGNEVVMTKEVEGSARIVFPAAGTYKLYMKTYNEHGEFDGSLQSALNINVISRIGSDPYTLTRAGSLSVFPGESIALNYDTYDVNGWLCISRDGNRFASHQLLGYEGKCTLTLNDNFTPGKYVCYLIVKSGNDIFSGQYVANKRLEFTVKNPDNIMRYDISASSTNIAPYERFHVDINGKNAEEARVYLTDAQDNILASFNETCDDDGRCSVGIRIDEEGSYRVYAVTSKADGEVTTFDGSPQGEDVGIDISVNDTTAFTFEKDNFFYINTLYSFGYKNAPPVLSSERYIEALGDIYGVTFHNNADEVEGFGYGMCAAAALIRQGNISLSDLGYGVSFLHGVAMPGTVKNSQIRDLVERLQLVQLHPDLANERNSNKNSYEQLITACMYNNAGVVINLESEEDSRSLLALSGTLSRINVYDPANLDNRDDYLYPHVTGGATYNGRYYPDVSFNLVDTIYTTLNKKDASVYGRISTFALDETDMDNSILLTIDADVFSIVRMQNGIATEIAGVTGAYEYSGVEDCSNNKAHYYILPKGTYVVNYGNCKSRLTNASVSGARATINTQLTTEGGRLVVGCPEGTDRVYCVSGSDTPTTINVTARNALYDTQEFIAEEAGSLSVVVEDDYNFTIMADVSEVLHNTETLVLSYISDDDQILDGSSQGMLVQDNIDDYFDSSLMLMSGDLYPEYPCNMDAIFDITNTDGIVNGDVGIIASNPDNTFRSVKVSVGIYDLDNRLIHTIEKDVMLGGGNTYIPVSVEDVYVYTNEGIIVKAFLWGTDMEPLAYNEVKVIY